MQDRAFDQAGLDEHQIDGGGLIYHRVFRSVIELPPGRAAFVQQCFPTCLRGDFLQPRCVYPVLFKVVEIACDVMTGKPCARFFDRVAIGDAVKFHLN